jgi:hypothetical protein
MIESGFTNGAVVCEPSLKECFVIAKEFNLAKGGR